MNLLRLVVTVVGLFSMPVSDASAATAPDYGGMVANFIKTHPAYRGYVTPQPPYPVSSRHFYVQGTVVVNITFAKSGGVATVVLVQSSGNEVLDGHTIEFIKRFWRSTLGKQTTYKMTLNYRLKR